MQSPRFATELGSILIGTLSLLMAVPIPVLGQTGRDDAASNDAGSTMDAAVSPEAATTTGAAVATDRFCLWAIESESNVVYLVGSIHLATPEIYPLSAPIENAYEASERIIFETDIAALDGPKAQQTMMSAGIYSDGTRIADHISDALLVRLKERLKELGLPYDQLAAFRPWLLAVTISVLELQKRGYDAASGLDKHFWSRGEADGKELGQLESVEFQIGLFGELGDDESELFLDQTLTDVAGIDEIAETLFTQWRAGDARGIAESFVEQFEEYPALAKRFLFDRNEAWVPQIEAWIGASEDVMFVVGTGHLVGNGSVIQKLETLGHSVEQR